jgi:hypothetical protein
MLPTDVLYLIASYVEEVPLMVHPELSWSLEMLENPHATDLIRDYLCGRPIGIAEMRHLVRNPIPEFLYYVDFESYPEFIPHLCTHRSEEAMQLLETLPQEEWQWSALSANPYAIRFLETNRENIYLEILIHNPKAYPLVKEILEESKASYRGSSRNVWEGVRIFIWANLMSGIHREQARQDFPQIARRIVEEPPSELQRLCSRTDSEEELLEWLSQHDSEEYDVELLSAVPWKSVLQVLQRVIEPDPQILNKNPAAIDLLLEDLGLVRWYDLAKNPSPRVIEVVLKYRNSFMATTFFNRDMYKRREILVTDEKKYRQTLEQKVKILSQY